MFGNDVPEPRDKSLKDEDEETQLEAMRTWFHENFQDPVEETPYDGREGGYQYLYGGPYDPKDELEAHFSDTVPEELIEKLADELSDQAIEWEGRARPEDFDDDYLVGTIERPSEHVKRFRASIASIRKLIETQVEQNEEQFFRRMLFASVITALETYLSDRFVSSITNNPAALRKFVETFPRFKKEGIKLSHIFKKSDGLQSEIKTMLLTEIAWHRLIFVGKMFTSTFGVDFREPQDQARLLQAVEVRHDIVHRGGKTKDGLEHAIAPDQIENLIVEADHLVSWIDCQNDKFNTNDPTVK